MAIIQMLRTAPLTRVGKAARCGMVDTGQPAKMRSSMYACVLSFSSMGLQWELGASTYDAGSRSLHC